MANGLHMSGIETALSGSSIYWMLPGPAAFFDEISRGLTRQQALVVMTHGHGVLGFTPTFELALASAHFVDESPIRLTVGDGTHLESDIGHHFGHTTIDASRLAGFNTGGRPQVVVLLPKTERAQHKCREYLERFAQASLHEHGTVRLVVGIEAAESAWQRRPGIQCIAFNGALRPDEMHAYVGMRMLGRNGPGSTRLAQHLVAEFAGFDARFAEELMKLDEWALLGLPESLAQVAYQLPASDTVWREASTEAGSLAIFGDDWHAHVLHEWHLASHDGPMRPAAAKALRARYWRAALRALMPWLEERRHNILSILRPALQQHLAATGGRRQKVLPGSGKVG